MYPFGRNVEAIGIKMSNWHIALCKKIMSSHNIENYLDVAVAMNCAGTRLFGQSLEYSANKYTIAKFLSNRRNGPAYLMTAFELGHDFPSQHARKDMLAGIRFVFEIYHTPPLERQRSYGPVRFRNEALGLPTTLGDHVVTRAELEECCGTEPMLRHGNHKALGNTIPLFAGIDWGGGVHSRTVLVIAHMRTDFVFQVLQIFALQAREDPHEVVEKVARCCNYYGVSAIAADGGGNGHVYNRLLFAKVQPRRGLYAISYSVGENDPTPDGVLTKWNVNRSASIGVLFGRIKRKQLIFPCREDTDIYLDEFACETAQ
jgi:hypothetical protein